MFQFIEKCVCFYLHILEGDYYVTTLPPQPPHRPPNLPRINRSDETPSELPAESMDNLMYETGEDGPYESVDDVKEQYENSRPFPRVAVDEGYVDECYVDMTKPNEVTCEEQYEEIVDFQTLKGILHIP